MPSYIVPSNILNEIKAIFKQNKTVMFNDFKKFCLKYHPDLNAKKLKKRIYRAFYDADYQGMGLLDFDHFLIAYAFAFKIANKTHFEEVYEIRNVNVWM